MAAKQTVSQKVKMQAPDLSVSKANQDKAYRLIENFLNATEKRVHASISKFSTFSSLIRLIKKDKTDPSESFVLEVIERMQRDKMHSQVALQISDITMNRLQNLQKAMIFKILPFLLGFLGTSTLVVLILTSQPLSFENPWLARYLIALAVFLPLFIWGSISRSKVKAEMVASNILFQASSAYASAKMQGKGKIGALQNLTEMRRKAKAEEAKSKKKK